MQDLNKYQIILLCILISFVMSIATGIITTSLLMQAPVELTRTVNQVVERTIETVTTPVQYITNSGSGSKTIETVVVTEDDKVTGAISKNSPSIFRIREHSADGTVDNLYGLGMVVSKEGMIVSDKRYVSSVMTYTALTSDGLEIPLVPITVENKKGQIGFFKAKISTTTPYTFTPVNLDVSDLKLGQTVIAIGGDRLNSVSVGRVISLNTKNLSEGTSTPIKYISSVEADISPVDGVYGAPILSLSGNVVGMSMSVFVSSKSYIPSNIIKQELDQIKVVK